MPRQIVYKGKLVDRRYTGSIPLCAVPTCEKSARYIVMGNQWGEYCSDYLRFCPSHEEELGREGKDP